MFEHLTKYRAILVSGPQRSGTRIAAQIIAADTGYQYTDETVFSLYDRKQFEALLRHHERVVHCPSMSHILDQVAADDVLIVFMMRNLEDIRASVLRVNWNIGVYSELANYGFGTNKLAAKRYRKHGGQIAPLKYAYWWGTQRELCPHWLELNYESLAGHPLWISKEQRMEFAAKQTGILAS